MSPRTVVARLLPVVTVATISFTASAQDASRDATWSVEPVVGILHDAYDSAPDGSRSGLLVGLNVARRLSGQVSGVASFGYARVNDIGVPGPAPSRFIFRNEWIFASAGPAVALPIRQATLSLGMQLGFAWRRVPVSGSMGDPQPDPWVERDDFSVTGVLVPSAAIRYPLGQKMALAAGVSAYWLSFDEGGRTSPAATIGLSFAP